MMLLEEAFIHFIQAREELLGFKRLLTSPNHTLDERWEIFTRMTHCNILGNQSWGEGFIREIWPDKTLYDNFCINRHETVTYVELYEEMQDEDDFDQVKADQWRELALKAGKQSFTYDW